MSSAGSPGRAAATGLDYVHAGTVPRQRVRPEAMFDPSDPRIKQDLVRMILQWCEDEGYYASMLTIQDEANVKLAEQEHREALIHRMRHSIMEGDWAEVERLCTRHAFKNYKALLFAVYRQQYLELIAGQEYQKAFSLLNKRLKPLEAHARSGQEFKELCYLLTCKSVADGLPAWEGTVRAREQLVEHFQTVIVFDERGGEGAAATSGGGGAAGGSSGGGGPAGAGGGGSTHERGANGGGGSSGGGSDGGIAGGISSNRARQPQKKVPERRLIELLRQAYAYQVEFSHFHPRVLASAMALEGGRGAGGAAGGAASTGGGGGGGGGGAAAFGARGSAPIVRSLLVDYSCPMLPNSLTATLSGHSADVKSVAFLGRAGAHVISGGSDNTVCVWSPGVDGGKPSLRLTGHTARVWSVMAPLSGRFFVSAGAEGAVRVWRVGEAAEAAAQAGDGGGGGGGGVGNAPLTPPAQNRLHRAQLGSRRGTEANVDTGGSRTPHIECAHVLSDGQAGAVYVAAMSETERVVVSGGYDRKIRMYELGAGGKLTSVLSGHESAVTSAAFNPAANLIVSGSKDCRVKFWDVRSGLCIKSLSSPLIGEVSSVALSAGGQSFVVCSRDNANRLWDLRSAKSVVTYKGHTNTSANFVRARFGPNDESVIGGSEDGYVHLWDRHTGALLHRLGGHASIVYDVDWSERASQLASCSHDGTVRLWMWDAAVGYDC